MMSGRNLIIGWFILFIGFYLFLTSGCATGDSSGNYYDRCPAATWQYLGSSMPAGSEDILMEHSGRRACVRVKSCLTVMIKHTSVDYVAMCEGTITHAFYLRGN